MAGPNSNHTITEDSMTPKDSVKDYDTSTGSHDMRSSRTLSACTTIKAETILEVNPVTTTKGSSSILTIEEETLPKRNWRFYGTFGCLALLNFVCAIDATILSVALPTVAAALGATAIEAFWCGTILACVAKNVTVLLVGRCVQGIGGGGLVALTYVVLADLVSLRERGKWMALISLQWAIGTIIGPVIGGLFAEKTTWRWIFWFNLPFCVISAALIPICLRLNTKEGTPWMKLKAFDWLSSFLFVASATAFIIPITWGGIQYDWTSWRTLVPLFLGITGLLGFVLYSTYIPKDPLIRRSLFRSSTSLTSYLSTVTHGIILWSLLYYIPLYFEAVKHKGAIGAGVALFPSTFTSAPAAIVVGIVITKTGRYRPSIWIGWLLTTAGMGMSIVLKENTNTATWAAMLLIVGIGTGMLFSAQGFACQAPVSNRDIPFAGAMYSFFRALGQTLGVAISGVIFQNTFKRNILNTPFSAYANSWAKDASGLVEILKTWSDVGEQGVMKTTVIHAYVEGLRAIHIVMTVLSAVALVCSLIWIKEISLDRELETDQGFIHKKETAPKSASEKEQRKGIYILANMAPPIVNVTIQACIMTATSNVVAQLIAANRGNEPYEIDWTPVLQFVIFAAMNVPPNFLWQTFLEQTFPSHSTPSEDKKKNDDAPTTAEPKLSVKNTLIKFTLDQTVGATINTLLYSIAFAGLQGHSMASCAHIAQRDFWGLMRAGWTLWPAVSLLNFTVIRSVEGRNLVGGLAGVGWNIYLSLIQGDK
ncbi:hypothetical protein B7463_g5167, partial [Scytalidium lignicola]